jgi:hypothetical protein
MHSVLLRSGSNLTCIHPVPLGCLQAAYNQFPSLAARFDLRGLYIAPSNRSTFPEIVSTHPHTCCSLLRGNLYVAVHSPLHGSLHDWALLA